MDNKISIIIPAYNIEDCLPDTLDSVLAQTHEQIEVIVVNDGSKDGTGRIIDSYAARDRRIRAIHKENGGVTSARLRGVAEATGQWIGFVDGDDYIEPDMYARLLHNALTHRADISHCGYRMVFPSRVDYYYNTGRLVEQDRFSGLKDLVTGDFVEPGLVTKLFRAELAQGLQDRMDCSIRNNEDLLMNFYLFGKARYSVYEDICPYHYILRGGSATTAAINPHKLRDPLRVTRILLVEAPETLMPYVYPRLVRQLIWGATMEKSPAPELITPFRRETRQELRSNLRDMLRSQNCGKKLKLQALWAAVWPGSYALVHRVYSRVTGKDKKYEIK